MCDLFSGHTHNRDVREHDGAERDEHIREELFGWHPLTGEEEALRAFADRLHGCWEAANTLCNQCKRRYTKGKEQDGLEGVYPSSSAHSTEEHIRHNGDCNDSTTNGIRNLSTGDCFKCRTAAHNTNNDVRDKHQGGYDGDKCANSTGFPAVA